MAPVILATDKTQLTQFSGGKAAYPIYLTLGNLPKAVRRKPSMHACILLGYLSVDKINRESLTQRELRARTQCMFHESMRIILDPLKRAGEVGVEMVGGDGAVRLVFPIIASYVADYPEQCLVACTKYGTCPKCQCPAKNLQDTTVYPLRTQRWTEDVINSAKASATSIADFHQRCMNQEVSGSVYRPFWSGFPHTDIHTAITPDVLHQLYQGVLKHLTNWCTTLLSKEEMDRRVRALPPSFGVRHFKNGITSLSQISGMERKNIAKILLGVLVGAVPRQAILASRSLLDFIYLAQYPTHNDTTLGYMQEALDTFQKHKWFFVNVVGVRSDLNIPKFHSLMHYITAIRTLGTTDNYNTEMFERLHIDFAKLGWRASNQRDEFPQMVRWLSRQEKVVSFQNYLTWRDPTLLNTRSHRPRPSLPKYPSERAKLISIIQSHHHASQFPRCLKEYLNSFLLHRTNPRVAALHQLPFDRVDVYHIFKFSAIGLDDEESEEADVVKAQPATTAHPARFDAVVALNDDRAEATGLEGACSISIVSASTCSNSPLHQEHVLGVSKSFSAYQLLCL